MILLEMFGLGNRVCMLVSLPEEGYVELALGSKASAIVEQTTKEADKMAVDKIVGERRDCQFLQVSFFLLQLRERLDEASHAWYACFYQYQSAHTKTNEMIQNEYLPHLKRA